MGENELSEEGLRRYVNSEVHLKVRSKGMEPIKFKSLFEASSFIGISRQTLKYAHMLINIRGPSLLEERVEPKFSSSSGVSQHNIYPSWISKIFASKMPHSDLNEILLRLNSGVVKCPCGQTFYFASEINLDMEFRLHLKFCSKLP